MTPKSILKINPNVLFPTYYINPIGTGSIGTINNIVKSFFGVGCLAIPLLFHDGGIILTTLLLIMLTFVALYAIYQLIEINDLVILTETRQNMITRLKGKPAQPFEIIPGITDNDILPIDRENVSTPTLAELGYIAYGNILGIITNIAIFIGQFGCICAYLIFISTNISDITGIHRYIILLLTIIPTICLILIPDLAKLAFIGTIGNITYIFALLVIFYIGISHEDICCIEKDELQLFNLSAFSLLFGTLSFALEGTAVLFQIRDKMRQPHMFQYTTTISIILLTLIYWFVGFISYILYGNNTTSPIILSLPSNNLFTYLVKITLSLAILFTLPYQFYPLTQHIQSLLYYFNIDNDNDNFNHTTTATITTPSTTTITTTTTHDTNFNIQQQQQTQQQQTQQHDINNVSNDINNISNDINHIDPTLYTMNDFNIEQEQPQPSRRMKQYTFLLQLLIIFITVLIAILFPNFHLILALFGSLATSSLAFILPCLFWILIILRGEQFMASHYVFSRQILGHCSQIDYTQFMIWNKTISKLQKRYDSATRNKHRKDIFNQFKLQLSSLFSTTTTTTSSSSPSHDANYPTTHNNSFDTSNDGNDFNPTTATTTTTTTNHNNNITGGINPNQNDYSTQKQHSHQNIISSPSLYSPLLFTGITTSDGGFDDEIEQEQGYNNNTFLPLQPHFLHFPIQHVYFYTRTGQPININQILFQNYKLMIEYYEKLHLNITNSAYNNNHIYQDNNDNNNTNITLDDNNLYRNINTTSNEMNNENNTITHTKPSNRNNIHDSPIDEIDRGGDNDDDRKDDEGEHDTIQTAQFTKQVPSKITNNNQKTSDVNFSDDIIRPIPRLPITATTIESNPSFKPVTMIVPRSQTTANSLQPTRIDYDNNHGVNISTRNTINNDDNNIDNNCSIDDITFDNMTNYSDNNNNNTNNGRSVLDPVIQNQNDNDRSNGNHLDVMGYVQPPSPMTSTEYIKQACFPFFIVIVGIAASVVGVLDASHALLEHFW